MECCKIGLKETEFRLTILENNYELCNHIINLLDTQYSTQGYNFIGEYIDWSYASNPFSSKDKEYYYDISVKWDKNYYKEHKIIEKTELAYGHHWISKSLDELTSAINNN